MSFRCSVVFSKPFVVVIGWWCLIPFFCLAFSTYFLFLNVIALVIIMRVRHRHWHPLKKHPWNLTETKPKYSIIWKFCVLFNSPIFHSILVSGHRFNVESWADSDRFDSPGLFLADRTFWHLNTENEKKKKKKKIKISYEANMKLFSCSIHSCLFACH